MFQTDVHLRDLSGPLDVKEKEAKESENFTPP